MNMREKWGFCPMKQTLIIKQIVQNNSIRINLQKG